MLFHNDGKRPDGAWRFSNVAARAGVEQPRRSFPTFFFDYDNDGWLDLFVAAYRLERRGRGRRVPRTADQRRPRPALSEPAGRHVSRRHPRRGAGHRDTDDGPATTATSTTMAGSTSTWARATPTSARLVPNRMFRNDTGRRFQDVTTAGNFGHLQKGHAIAWGDVDNDGDEDIFELMGGAYQADRAYSALYENPGLSVGLGERGAGRRRVQPRRGRCSPEGGRAHAARPTHVLPNGQHRRQLRVIAAAAGHRTGGRVGDRVDRSSMARQRPHSAGTRPRDRTSLPGSRRPDGAGRDRAPGLHAVARGGHASRPSRHRRAAAMIGAVDGTHRRRWATRRSPSCWHRVRAQQANLTALRSRSIGWPCAASCRPGSAPA